MQRSPWPRRAAAACFSIITAHLRVLIATCQSSAACLHPFLQTKLEQDIAYKQQMREQVAQQLEGDMDKFKQMEREAAALISKTRHINSKLMVGILASAAAKQQRHRQYICIQAAHRKYCRTAQWQLNDMHSGVQCCADLYHPS